MTLAPTIATPVVTYGRSARCIETSELGDLGHSGIYVKKLI